MLVYVVIPSLVGAVDFGGGLAMHTLGIAVVGWDGKPSQWRSLRRALIAWLPFLVSPLLVNATKKVVGVNYSLISTITVLGIMTLVSLAMSRSLQDRLACTYLVPRGESEETDRGAKGKKRISWVLIRIAVLLALLMAISQFVFHSAKSSNPVSTGALSFVPTAGGKVCIALLPDGTSAANATIFVATDKNASLTTFKPGDYYPRGMQETQADALGRFNLPAVPGDMPVILTHPKGLLVTTAADARKVSGLRLQAFGRIEGTLLSEGKPKTGVSVSIDTLTPKGGLYLACMTPVEERGKFVLTDLPAGEYRLYRDFMPRRHTEGPFAMPPSHQKIITVKAGETVQLQYGGNGRSVIGQAVPENPNIAVDWLNDTHSLELVLPTAANGLTQFMRESFGLGESLAEEKHAKREQRSYHLEFEEDGSFRAEDVPPGNYELRIKVTKPGPPGRDHLMHQGEELGSLMRKVTIPPGKEPFDLGRQIVAVKGEPSGGSLLPLDANLTTVEGQPLRLAGMRGKYVVLVFWASWSKPSKKMLADLGTVRDEFARDGKVEFIAASVDDDAGSLRQAAATSGIGFTLARLTVSERASATEAFDVTTLPAVLLIGPDGRVAGRDLEPERLKAALRRALAASP